MSVMTSIYTRILWIVFTVQYVECHEHSYKINYHNEQQAVHVSKDNDQTDIHFGDIVNIGNNRQIVYVGDGNWREKDKLESKVWPAELHQYTAEDMDAWPQFVKTGFEVLDDQLNRDEGDLDQASSVHSVDYNTYTMKDNEDGMDNMQHLHIETKTIMLISFMVLLCCVGTICIGGMICICCTLLRSKRKKYNRDIFESREYLRLPMNINISDAGRDCVKTSSEEIDDVDM